MKIKDREAFSLNHTKSNYVAKRSTKISDFGKTRCGVYFLLRDSVVVYVGQSKHHELRISEHVREKQKDFDSFYFIECAPLDLNLAELYWIIFYKPIYNGQFYKHGKLSITTLANIYCLQPGFVIYLIKEEGLRDTNSRQSINGKYDFFEFYEILKEYTDTEEEVV